jgi:hypothetical protein
MTHKITSKLEEVSRAIHVTDILECVSNGALLGLAATGIAGAMPGALAGAALAIVIEGYNLYHPTPDIFTVTNDALFVASGVALGAKYAGFQGALIGAAAGLTIDILHHNGYSPSITIEL